MERSTRFILPRRFRLLVEIDERGGKKSKLQDIVISFNAYSQFRTYG
jgi:hypothetical protein